MSNYLPDYQKDDRAFNKRERALISALKKGAPLEKLEQSAEHLREAKIRAYKTRGYMSNDTLKLLHQKAVLKWLSSTTKELIQEYKNKLGQHS